MLESDEKRNATLERFGELLSYGPLRAIEEDDVFSVFDRMRVTGGIMIAQESPDTWFIDLFRSDALIKFYTQCMELLYEKKNEYLDFPDNMLVKIYLELNLTLWNITDKSVSVASRLLMGNVVSLMHRLLKLEQLNLQRCREQRKIRLVVHSTVGILINGIRHFCMIRAVYCKDGIVGILTGLINNEPTQNLVHILDRRKTNEDIQMLSLHTACLLLLAFVGDENEILTVTDDHIVYILYALEDALNHAGTFHSPSFGYDAIELLQGLYRLAGSEKNALLFLKNKAIDLIEKTLRAAIMQKHNPDYNKSSCSPDKLACTALNFLLSLCYVRKNNVYDLEFRRLIDVFRKSEWLPSCQRTSESISYVLDQEADRVTEQYSSPTEVIAKDRRSDLPNGHIMISYQHNTKAFVDAVKNELENHGFRVWVDSYNACGSFLNAMAEAIDDAAAVIAAVCQEFKLSPYCRTEMRYAFERKKIIIPLLLEPNFQPSGWLQFLWLKDDIIPLCDLSEVSSAVKKLASTLDDIGVLRSYSGPSAPAKNHQITDRYSLRNSIGCEAPTCNLSSDFANLGNEQNQDYDPINHEFISPRVAKSNQSTRNDNLIRKWFPSSLEAWSNDHISLWLLSNDLSKYIETFADIDGPLLVEMIHMYQTCPDHLAESLQSDMHMPLVDRLRLFHSFEKLKSAYFSD